MNNITKIDETCSKQQQQQKKLNTKKYLMAVVLVLQLLIGVGECVFAEAESQYFEHCTR